MQNKHRLTRNELEDHLTEQLEFLKRSAEAFDAGFKSEAKRMALAIRILLHEARSPSLLRQLDLKGQLFASSVQTTSNDNLVSTFALLSVAVESGRVNYVPRLDSASFSYKPFDDWWGEVIFVDTVGNCLGRKDLVLSMADKDGGAHVDPVLNSSYADLSKRFSLGCSISINEGEPVPLEGAERTAVRQIAHEVLKSLLPDYVAPERLPLATGSSDEAVPETIDIVFQFRQAKRPDPRSAEISGGKMRFYPEAGDVLFKNDGSPTNPGKPYVFEVLIDSITEGCIRGVVGGAVSDEIRTAGLHRLTVVAGSDQLLGIFGSATDAVLDRVSVVEVP